MKTLESRGIESPRLLIVDDDPSITSQLRLALSGELSIEVAHDTEAAWDLVQAHRPDVVTLDLAIERGDPETGFALLQKCLGFDPFIKVIMITGNDTRENALRAVEHGGADFFGKPVDPKELKVMVNRAVALGRLERQNASCSEHGAEEDRLGSLIGQSANMSDLFQSIVRVASADIAVLILGESGTGKELVAKELRRLSSRSDGPFVSINCGAIPENLIESELFGHEKGAFTGAHNSRVGRLEAANGGIVFLDEVGELPLLLQVKLLHFLQDHRIERVGGQKTIELDVRVIAATNRDLEREVKSGRFRQDLYYRLSVVNLKLPPLRDRRTDILLLAEHFLEKFGKELNRGRRTFSARAKAALREHEWPGNVRELEHQVQKAVLMSNGRIIDSSDLDLSNLTHAQGSLLKDQRREADSIAVREALQVVEGNISAAAKRLGISRPSLHELLHKLDIQARDYKPRR